MKTWHFFRNDSGLFDGRSFSATDAVALSLNVPEGFGAIEGVTDWQSQRVNVTTAEIVDYQPPSPGATHKWDSSNKRWIVRPEIIERDRREAEIIAGLKELDAKLVRPLGELALPPLDERATDDERKAREIIIADALAMVDLINKLKGAQRAELSALRAA